MSGCSLLPSYYDLMYEEIEQEEQEPSFSEDPVHGFKQMIDEGWRVSVQNGELIFIRHTEKGIEMFKPLK